MKIKKGDKIIVLAGKDKGKKALVLKAMPTLNKIIVEGVNIVKKHQKTKERGKTGSIVNITMPIDVSNVAILDSKGNATRVGYKMEGAKKVRFAKKTSEIIK